MKNATLDPFKAALQAIPEYSTARIQFYYSSLPARKTANPTGYSSALSWWRKTLSDLTATGIAGEDKLVLNVDEDLRENLRWDKVGRPSSLGVVVGELAASSDLVALETYLASPTPQGFSVLSLLSRPFWWSVSKLVGSTDLGEQADETEWSNRKGKWVIPDLVQKAASNLTPLFAELHVDSISRLYTINSFRDKFGTKALTGVTLSRLDCKVIVAHLAGEGHCAIEGDVIKFAAPRTTSSNSVIKITESDKSILNLVSTLSTLSSYITSLEQRIANERARAIEYLAKKQTTMVKSHLGAQKRLERVLQDRVASRDKLEQVMIGIERAKGDEETLEALSLGSSTLRQILQLPTLQLSNIEATTAALDETLVAATEIKEAVDSVTPLEEGIELEIEDELKQLQIDQDSTRAQEVEVERERNLLEARVPTGEISDKDKLEQKQERGDKVAA
ncbi:phosphatidic acid-binding protein CHM7 [Sporobolomyces koalae]|uniref:phosphatidic acid-binding protein CHM7 n=1 Tax=Sporobolomyces koalae TaxID=500713 RepID=UPI00316B1CA5